MMLFIPTSDAHQRFRKNSSKSASHSEAAINNYVYPIAPPCLVRFRDSLALVNRPKGSVVESILFSIVGICMSC
ncbi:hypothetical protein ACVBEF_09705, partial [Glaciimonas sp. GG7]